MCSVSLHRLFSKYLIISAFTVRISGAENELLCTSRSPEYAMKKPAAARAPAKAGDETASWETKVKERGNERGAFHTIAKIQTSGELKILHEHQFSCPLSEWD